MTKIFLIVELSNTLIREKAALEQAVQMATKANHVRKKGDSNLYMYCQTFKIDFTILVPTTKKIYAIVIRRSLATERYLSPIKS